MAISKVGRCYDYKFPYLILLNYKLIQKKITVLLK